MRKSSSLPKYKRFLVLKNLKYKNSKVIKKRSVYRRSFSQGKTTTLKINEFFKKKYFFSENIFHFKERNYYIEKNFNVLFKKKKKEFKKQLEKFYYETNHMDLKKKLELYYEMKKKKKLVN